MADYYVNNTRQENGDHEVHVNGCNWLARAQSTTYLGNYMNCQGAVMAAKRMYPTANGCAYCAPSCHTS